MNGCHVSLYDDDVYRIVSESANMEQAAGRSSSSSATAKPSSSQSTDIPEGLYDLLKGVTVAVLRDRPTDLYSFVADYFTKVRSRAVCSSAHLVSAPQLLIHGL